MNPKTILLLAMGLMGLAFLGAWVVFARKNRDGEATLGDSAATGLKHNSIYHAVVGFVCGFFDTLGIGNFAPTTAAFKLRGSVADEDIPGTLNVGYAIPTIVQALIYTSVVEVDFTTLILMILAAVAGAWLGSGIVARMPRRAIQAGMGSALLVAGSLMLLTQLQISHGGGDAVSLEGTKLWIGLACNFVLGALMTLGIGLYAPCLILVSLLGMNPRTAFPIMMGSCAFLMSVAGIRFIRQRRHNQPASVVLTLAGIPAVLLAAYVVKEMPLEYVRWLVIFVVAYAAITMLRSALAERKSPSCMIRVANQFRRAVARPQTSDVGSATGLAPVV